MRNGLAVKSPITAKQKQSQKKKQVSKTLRMFGNNSKDMIEKQPRKQQQQQISQPVHPLGLIDWSAGWLKYVMKWQWKSPKTLQKWSNILI